MVLVNCYGSSRRYGRSKMELMTSNGDLPEFWIDKVSGTIKRDEEHPDRPIIGLDFGFGGVTDAMLNRILGIATLKKLSVHSCKVTDAWLKHLSSFPALEEFIAGDNPITDAGLKHLG